MEDNRPALTQNKLTIRGQIDDYSNDDQGQQTGSSIEEIEEDTLTMTEEDRLTT